MSSSSKKVKHSKDVLEGNVGSALLRMSASMMIGFIAGAAFNITDTFYVSRLGTNELAAMGYTFPIVMVIFSIVFGIGIGTSSVLSRAIGQGNNERIRQMTVHALLLGVVIVGVFVTIGYLTLEPVLAMLGANEVTLPLAKDYMSIWLAGMVCVIIPIIGNNCIRATGDTLTPSIIMVVDLGLNIVLDPIFIFGFGPVPAMGIKGAAIATVISRAFAVPFSLSILGMRNKMLTFHAFKLRDIISSWGQILYIGLPVGATNLLTPLTAGIITRLISGFGVHNVAALSAGTRIEHFTVIPLIALGASMVPFIGQNWGAKAYHRVRQAQKISYIACISWGAFCVILLVGLCRFIAPIFTRDPDVFHALMIYLCIMPVAFGFRGICMAANGSMNAINHPLHSSAMTVIRLVIFQWPLAFTGAKLFGYKGILVGIVISEILAALLSASWLTSLFRRHAKPAVKTVPTPDYA
jgi:putative MATE family efflux protein